MNAQIAGIPEGSMVATAPDLALGRDILPFPLVAGLRRHPPPFPPPTQSPNFIFRIPDAAGPPFRCPEKNGFFPDLEQCDKYYECVAEIPEEKFCPDGLLFDATDPNSELCDYPFNVDCGDREYVRKCSFPFLNLFPRYTLYIIQPIIFLLCTLQRSLSQG